MKEKDITKEELLELLKNNTLEVTFTKVNGEQRVMLCTLIEEFIPPKKQTESTRKVEHKDNFISVIDVEASEWRGFYFDSITSVNIMVGE